MMVGRRGLTDLRTTEDTPLSFFGTLLPSRDGDEGLGPRVAMAGCLDVFYSRGDAAPRLYHGRYAEGDDEREALRDVHANSRDAPSLEARRRRRLGRDPGKHAEEYRQLRRGHRPPAGGALQGDAGRRRIQG